MAYEPAINTTVTPTEKIKHWLDRAVEAAHHEGIGIIGFLVSWNAGNTVFEPFASSDSLDPEEFARLMNLAARQMLNERKPPIN